MKPFIFCGALIFCGTLAFAAPKSAKLSPRPAPTLRFARGATSLEVRGFLSGLQSRVYWLETRAGQKLRISVSPASKRRLQLVPLVFVTPPRGHYNGEKTATYASNSTRAGFYKIEVRANSMASNARSGSFVLRVFAR